jgi:hypothetical protein
MPFTSASVFKWRRGGLSDEDIQVGGNFPMEEMTSGVCACGLLPS